MFELPKALVEAGSKVSVVLPNFASMQKQLAKYEVTDVPGVEIRIPFTAGTATLTAKKTVISGIDVYLLSVDNEFFQKPYSGAKEEFFESILLSRGALELLMALGIQPQIVHSNDHHTALVPLYMRTLYRDHFAKTGSVFTIHNIGYQGTYPASWLPELGLKLAESLVIKSGMLNLMAVVPEVIKKLRAEGSYINTVSETYAKEIRRTKFDVDMLLTDVGHRFGGILNGIDYEVWDPKADREIAANYSILDGIEKVIDAR